MVRAKFLALSNQQYTDPSMSSPKQDESQLPSKLAIISPAIDFLCCGGVSILVVLAIFAVMIVAPDSPLFGRPVELKDILIFGFLINFPHFMASYRILYRKPEQITEHSWAAIYAPLILIALIVYAVLTPSQAPENTEFANGTIIEVVTLTAAMLLAWHYTMQAWGMTASFSFIGGIRMEDVERRAIRSGCYALMVLHVIWASLMAMSTPDEYLLFSSIFYPYLPQFEYLFFGWWLIVAATIPLGIWGFVRMHRRTGKPIPWRAVSPWVAIYMWYALITFRPGMFALLQIFHALQYLIFPIRVEMNQYAMRLQDKSAKEAKSKAGTSSSRAASAGSFLKRALIRHGVLYYVALVLVGFVVFASPNLLRYVSDDAFLAINALLIGFVNIHHYVIDGAIWKIRNPAVRRDLFAHLQPQTR